MDELIGELKIANAIGFAERAHKGQLDDNGKDYFDTHLLPVYECLCLMTDDINIQSAGLLHDVIEDTPVTEMELRMTFGDKITNLVLEVTQEGEADSYGYYFPRLKTRGGIMIKFADRLSNLSRMQSWDGKRKAQYLRRSKFWKSEGSLHCL